MPAPTAPLDSPNPPAPAPLASPRPWDLVSAAYAAEVAPVFEHYARQALQLAAPAPGARIVDVACGPGTLAAVAALAGHPVDAIDFSPLMIDRLHARVAAGLTGVTPRVGDGQALPYADGAFGAGFSQFGLMFFPDRARGLAELRRVLAPGARAVIASWQPLDAVPELEVVLTALARGADRPQAAEPFPLSTAEACRAEMGAAFADVEVHAAHHAQPYASPAELWESFARTLAPLVLLRDQLGAAGFAPLAAELRAALEAQLGPGPGQLVLHAWLTVGVAR